MRIAKKLLTMALALVLVLTAGIMPVRAAEGFTITFNNSGAKTDHTYQVYQIFTGDLSKDGTTLSNIVWGTGVSAEGQETLGAADERAAGLQEAENDSEAAKAFAEEVSAFLSTPKTVKIAAGQTNTLTGLDAGYYLIKDDTNTQTGENSAYTRYIMQVVNDITVTPKLDVPSVEKKVQEKNDTTGVTSEWQDAADYDIGDAVPFKLTATLPGNFSVYKNYKVFTFTDTLSAGLTAPDADEVKVSLNTADGPSLNPYFDVTIEGQKIQVSLKEGIDLKELSGDVALSDGDKIVVTYSAVLNDKAQTGSTGNENKVYLTYSNNPNANGEGDQGSTPEDKVVVFTYSIVANKVNKDQKALAGAGFTLYKKVNNDYAQVGQEITGVTTFEFKGVDAGEYKLVETTVPDGYNKAEDLLFTVEATYDTNSVVPKLTSLTVNKEVASQFTTDTTAGTVTTTIVNYPGNNLPSTGGMGTTLFYLFGSILIAFAAVSLILKRRKDA